MYMRAHMLRDLIKVSWCSWLSHLSNTQEVSGSIPDETSPAWRLPNLFKFYFPAFSNQCMFYMISFGLVFQHFLTILLIQREFFVRGCTILTFRGGQMAKRKLIGCTDRRVVEAP